MDRNVSQDHHRGTALPTKFPMQLIIHPRNLRTGLRYAITAAADHGQLGDQPHHEEVGEQERVPQQALDRPVDGGPHEEQSVPVQPVGRHQEERRPEESVDPRGHVQVDERECQGDGAHDEGDAEAQDHHRGDGHNVSGADLHRLPPAEDE
jgi:hypothetical protein